MHLTKEDILSYLAAHKMDFSREFNITKLGLFGSFAKGEAHPESDIDVLVEFAPSTENLREKKARFRALLQQQFRRKVDLCREKYIKPYFRAHILNAAIYV